MSDHGGNNVVDVAGKEEDAGGDDGCQLASDDGEQFIISFGADVQMLSKVKAVS